MNVWRKNSNLLQETKRPSKEMQVSIARQLGLQPTTVGNFFMNARRRLHDKWQGSEHADHATSEIRNHATSTSTHLQITTTTNPGAKIENNNDSSSNMAACIMVDYPAHSAHSSAQSGQAHAHPDSHHDHDHDLDGFSLDSFEPVTSEAAAASCVYSLTSL